ncbi:MAG TPA: ABC transporter ATP-binding protein [Anaerolineales bacterium]|nr:ABC transporter ATP-binding protein [Anaerolineales bacterium]
MMPDEVVLVKDFRKIYSGTVAVDGISFGVQRGEIFGLLGPNGAGKTTTMESLEGLRQPTSGSLVILGVDPTRQQQSLRNLIGVQLQASSLPGSMTSNEAMEFFCAYHQVPSRHDLLERLGLGDKYHAQFSTLSTGLQRRLALALAIAHDPPVLLLDEPTAGLDVASRVELHEVMHELKAKGTTIILATHDMAEAEKMTDRVAILLKGKIAATGSPIELTAAGSGLVKISVASENSCLSHQSIDFPAVTQKLTKDEYMIYYSSDAGETVPAVLGYLKQQADHLVDLRVERPSLEDRFLEITQTGSSMGGEA